MDIFMPIALCVIFIILFTICGWCCKRKREGTVFGYGPSVTITTTTTQPHLGPSPRVVPPYPIDPRHPTPANNAPMPGFAANQPPYPTHTPHMPFPQGSTPYPPGGHTPYPPAAYPPATNDYGSNPPPYDVAVSQPPLNPPAPMKEVYGKQAPYNPGYN